MTMKQTVVVAGLGEVGKPLFELIAPHHHVVGVDVNNAREQVTDVDVLHICYPFQIPDFIGESVRYIQHFQPKFTVINSTVAVGTSRAVADAAGVPVVNSPIRGKHAHMLADLRKYTKFLGATHAATAELAAQHFSSVGLKTKILPNAEATELAKLTETTYFGVLIAWAQEVERYCDSVGADYDAVTSFYEEIGFFPSTRYFPGIIGGHCVLPNIAILRDLFDSELLEAVDASNEKKKKREASLQSNHENSDSITLTVASTI